MGAPAKFLFDVDFAVPEAEKERAAATAEAVLQVADAEARGYREGFDAAQREAKAESDRRTALAFEEMAMSMRAVAGRFGDIEQRMETEAVDVAVAVARKLSSELVAAEPLTDILALVGDCFRHLTATPHLAVRINDALYDETRERVERLAHQSGFAGKLVILSSPDIETGDCRIEWADGGMTLERAAIDAKINELVGRYMASRGQIGLSNAAEERTMTETETGVPLPDLNAAGLPAMDDAAAFDQDDNSARIASDLEAVFDVPVQVSAVLGRSRMDVAELLKLGPGTVLELDRRVGEAIDIYVNNRLIARGEVVLVEDKLGVTMTEIIKAERV